MKKKKVMMTIAIISIIIAILAGISIHRILGIKADPDTGSSGENEGTTQTNDENEEISPAAIDTSNWNLEKVNIVYDEDNVPVPVPKGYTASSVLKKVNSAGQVTNPGEKTVNTGFVIYEGEEPVTDTNLNTAVRTRNQWVWVPVRRMEDIVFIDEKGIKHGKLWEFNENGRTEMKLENDSVDNREPDVSVTTDNYESLPNNLPQTNQSDLFLELQIYFEDTMASIERYGGFYIGRYETSDVTTEKAKVVKGKSNFNHSWFQQYRRCLSIDKNNENVQPIMIWGSLWDQTLEWLVESGNKTYQEIVNSNSWGGKASSKTGASEKRKANNIYDLAGNAKERTLEVENSEQRNARVLRGAVNAADRNGGGSGNACRAMLYIK